MRELTAAESNNTISYLCPSCTSHHVPYPKTRTKLVISDSTLHSSLLSQRISLDLDPFSATVVTPCTWTTSMSALLLVITTWSRSTAESASCTTCCTCEITEGLKWALPLTITHEHSVKLPLPQASEIWLSCHDNFWVYLPPFVHHYYELCDYYNWTLMNF